MLASVRIRPWETELSASDRANFVVLLAGVGYNGYVHQYRRRRQAGIFNPRVLLGFVFSLVGVALALLSLSASSSPETERHLISNSPIAEKNASGAALIPAVGEWALVPSPNKNDRAEPNWLYSVTCVSASDCWAVGEYQNVHYGHQTLIEHWDGTAWSIIASPNVVTEYNILYSVICVSASNCWAVGEYHTLSFVQKTLVEHWDGLSWSVVASPNLNDEESNALMSVTCTSASDCWAVGFFDENGAPKTLTEHWNGASWSIVASPSPTETSSLDGVACLSPSNCWGVGYYHVDDGGFGEDRTLVEHWDGASWSVVGSPNVGMYSYLHAVRCISVSECWSVGEFNNNGYAQTLIERWNGSSWTVVNSPNTGAQEDNQLSGLTCVSTQNCWAVGSFNRYRTLVEHWDGNTWSLIASPNASAADDRLYGVACTSAANCWSVGRYKLDSPIVEQTLAQRWNGSSWAVVNSANTAGIQANNLSGVTCTSASDCWAVGHYDANIPKGLIQHWDGTQWTIVAAGDGVLADVACVSPSDCWAVGYTNRPLMKHWNGSAWAIMPSPDIEGVIYGVACASSSSCWAVGAYYDNGVGAYRTLIEHWNGAAWAVVSSPNASTGWNWLNAVTCTSSSSCWAVGWYADTGGVRKALIERWNGTAWSLVAAPSTGAGNEEFLNAVTCNSLTDCWAVGLFTGAGGLIEHWNGTSWQITPNSGSSQYLLEGVKCATSSQCWAVGTYSTGGFYRTLTEQWDGTSWSIVSSPNFSTTRHNALYSLACVSGSDCWAVGEHYSDGSPDDQTLIEQFTVAPSLTGAASRKTHGSAGTFSVALPGIECRSGGASAAYQLVFSFMNNLTSVSSATATGGTVNGGSIGPNPNEYTVNLTSVPNAQLTTVTLNTVQDASGNIGNVSRTMSVLVGDTNASSTVSSADVAQTKSRIGQPVDAANFRSDVNANGVINATDAASIKSSIGSGLP